MKLFYKLKGASDALGETECIFQNEIGPGRRVYVIGTNKEYWDEYLSRGVRNGYECIRKGIPCHLYIDLDVDQKKYPSIKVVQIWHFLEKWIDLILVQHMLINESDITKHIQFSCNEDKGSMHIIYNIKNRIFKTNAHVGAFMRCVREAVERETPEHMSIFDNKLVDMSIYTKNRLFRMLGCTKYGQDRYLTDGNPYTYENWVKTKVQPLNADNIKYIDMVEIDGSEPSYSGHGASGSTITPDDISYLKPLFEHIESQFNTRITRYHEFPMTMIIACNLKTKHCNFKGEAHSKNTPYIIVNLANNVYSYRCHSAKCKGHWASFDFPDYIRETTNSVTERKCMIPTILI